MRASAFFLFSPLGVFVFVLHLLCLLGWFQQSDELIQRQHAKHIHQLVQIGPARTIVLVVTVIVVGQNQTLQNVLAGSLGFQLLPQGCKDFVLQELESVAMRFVQNVLREEQLQERIPFVGKVVDGGNDASHHGIVSAYALVNGQEHAAPLIKGSDLFQLLPADALFFAPTSSVALAVMTTMTVTMVVMPPRPVAAAFLTGLLPALWRSLCSGCVILIRTS